MPAAGAARDLLVALALVVVLLVVARLVDAEAWSQPGTWLLVPVAVGVVMARRGVRRAVPPPDEDRDRGGPDGRGGMER